jgi:hypothetical protein
VPKKLPEADFSRQSRKKIANCDIGDRQRDPWSSTTSSMIPCMLFQQFVATIFLIYLPWYTIGPRYMLITVLQMKIFYDTYMSEYYRRF